MLPYALLLCCVFSPSGTICKLYKCQQHSGHQWVPMNGHKALSRECTRKTVTLASKSASSLLRASLLSILPLFPFFSFPFISSHPLYSVKLQDIREKLIKTEIPKNQILNVLIYSWCCKCWSPLTFQQVSCQTWFCPGGPNKVWQDRVHVQSHVIMCVRCPRCSGGLGGRQPSRSHLEKKDKNNNNVLFLTVKVIIYSWGNSFWIPPLLF